MTDLLEPDPLILDIVKMRKKQKGLTQKVVAERMGVPLKSVRHFETGKSDPYISTIGRYCMVIGVQPHYTIVPLPPPPPQPPWRGKAKSDAAKAILK